MTEYVAYFDESGDHGLENIDPKFPMFVLCGVVFKIDEFLACDLPAFTALKFKHFGHDAVVFHSYKIRKRLGPFAQLIDNSKREAFLADISGFFGRSNCKIIAAGIDKERHRKQYRYPRDPYDISLLFCLERLCAHLMDFNARDDALTCIFEMRGETDDTGLAAHFVRICGGECRWGPLPYKMQFVDKRANMAGLQIADLAAYPIARHFMNPAAPNPAFDAIYPRFRHSTGGKVDGYGLKLFP